jgi:predicted cobalt transporter CbtA
MPRVLPIALIVGLIAGLLVGGFHNLFTVPVMERAIALEEERAAPEAPAGAMEHEGEGAVVSLGVQRIGMVVGLAILGLIVGLIFAGFYRLLQGIVPDWHPLAIALIVGAVGFWALSLFPFIKYPLNPPGVGESASLTFRQGFQTLFILLSAAGAVGALYGIKLINRSTSVAAQWVQRYALVALAYAIFALVIAFAIPGNPDPTPVPVDLLALFRTLSMVGQFLLWLVLALGVGLTIMWYQRSGQTVGNPGTGNMSPRASAH